MWSSILRPGNEALDHKKRENLTRQVNIRLDGVRRLMYTIVVGKHQSKGESSPGSQKLGYI